MCACTFLWPIFALSRDEAVSSGRVGPALVLESYTASPPCGHARGDHADSHRIINPKGLSPIPLNERTVVQALEPQTPQLEVDSVCLEKA